MDINKGENPKEQRIRKLTSLYYSNPDVQKAIFDFSAGREVVPRYFEGFGKRPDSLQYKGDVFSLIKKGATSLHCSEEIWSDPLKVVTGMSAKQLNEIRTGWDLLLDIDSKYFDYSRVFAKIVVKILNFYGVKHFGMKFSGSKGFHIIIPSKAFPLEINGIKTSEMFPEWPRIITQFVMELSKKELIEKVTDLTKASSGMSKYVKDFEAPKEVMPDLVLVSPRHLFRMPYSLHEKTSLASVVVTPEELDNFQPRDADPLKVRVRNFMPDSKEGEASELLREALDWHKNKAPDETQKASSDGREFKQGFAPVKITDLKEEMLPPSIKRILQGVSDGRKRSLFVILNLFRAIGLEKLDLEKRIKEWNERNEQPLDEKYIQSQLSWSYRNKIVLPPNYDKDYYKGIGIIPTPEELRFKNPVSYIARKAQAEAQNQKPAPKIKPKKIPKKKVSNKKQEKQESN